MIFITLQLRQLTIKKWLIFIQTYLDVSLLYQSDLISFLAYDNEHHRIAIANTSDILKELSILERFVMRFKIFLNRKIPSIEGLDHISY
jgi:hypothetical protein